MLNQRVKAANAMRMHSLDDVDFLHACLSDVPTVELVGRLVEATSEGVTEPVRADLGPRGT